MVLPARLRLCNLLSLNELPVVQERLLGGTEVALQVWSPPPLAPFATANRCGDHSGMESLVALEPLTNGVLALAAAVILLAIYILLARTVAALVRLRTNRREPLLTRLVYQALQSTPVNAREFRRLGRFDRKLVRSILLGLALDLRGETGEAIAALYGELGFLRSDLGRLKSRRPTTRASAAGDLGLIRFTGAVPALLQAFTDPDVRVRQAAVWAVGRTGGQAALHAVIRLLADPSRAVAQRAQEVLAERGREVVDGILAYTENTSSRPGRLAAIELLGLLKVTTASNLLLGFMSDPDPEVRVKSVKAAAAIGDPRFLEAFQARVEDSSWAVRCQAAKGLSVLGSPASVPRLNAALRDQHWWVRFYAATALAESGPAGEEALSQALRDPEPSVRDMARYLLERGEIVPALP
jgi:HEAT repeat protein